MKLTTAAEEKAAVDVVDVVDVEDVEDVEDAAAMEAKAAGMDKVINQEAANVAAVQALRRQQQPTLVWNCGKKGHRSKVCRTKTVHFADAVDDAQIFLTTIETFHPAHQESLPESPYNTGNIVSVLLSIATNLEHVIMLDTQSSIHLVSNPELLSDVNHTARPVVVQGITGDRIKVTLEGVNNDIGVHAYFSPNTAANILSYHKLQETHKIHYN